MKKVLAFVLVLCFVWATIALAQWPGFGGDPGTRGKVLVYEVINSTGADQTYDIPSSMITAGARIYHISVMMYDTTKGCEGWVGLFDTVNDGGANHAESVAEAEAVDQGIGEQTWVYGKLIETSLQARQGANTALQIEYTRK